MSSIARWCYRRRFTVLGLWFAGVILLGGISAAAGNKYNDSFSLPGTESTHALNLLQKSFPVQSGDTAQIVWHAKSGSVTAPAVKHRVTAMLDRHVSRREDLSRQLWGLLSFTLWYERHVEREPGPLREPRLDAVVA